MNDLKYKLFTVSTTILVFITQFGCAKETSFQASSINKAENTRKQSDSPDYEQIRKRVVDIVAKQLGVDSKEIIFNAPLSKQKIAADELDAVEIIMTLEEAFRVEINDAEIGAKFEDITNVLSAEKLANIVFEKKKQK